mgnify:FL=1
MQFCQKLRSGMKKKLQTAFTTRQYMLSKDFEIYYYNEKYTCYEVTFVKCKLQKSPQTFPFIKF